VHGNERRPVAVDLFAGAGGLSLGLESAGFDIAACVEYDPIHAAVHSFNFPRTKELRADISTVTADDLTNAVALGLEANGRHEWDGDIDLIAGGPPCQGFSTIGKRLIEDRRNRLVFEFFRLVSECRPRYFLMENVPGMIAGGHKTAILDLLIAEFSDAGYRMVDPVRVLRAPDHGVPQDRRRLVLIGAREDQRLPTYPSPSVRPRPKNASARRPHTSIWSELPLGPSVGDAINDLPDPELYDELLDADEVRLTTADLATMDERASPYARFLRGLDHDADDFGYPRAWNRSILTCSMRTAHTDRSVSRFSATAPGTTEPVSRFYRLTEDGLCNTIRAGTGSDHGAFTSPRPIHPNAPRVLTVREAARLHSFPDWFRLHRTKWHGFRQVGNAVPPLLARAVGSKIVEALGIAPRRPQKVIELGDAGLLSLDMSAAAARFQADPTSIPAPRRRQVA
jgi:DNA (cytosine-5)-methyltransferase 1